MTHLIDFAPVFYASRMMELWQIKARRRIIAVVLALTVVVFFVSQGFAAPEIFGEADDFVHPNTLAEALRRRYFLRAWIRRVFDQDETKGFTSHLRPHGTRYACPSQRSIYLSPRSSLTRRAYLSFYPMPCISRTGLARKLSAVFNAMDMCSTWYAPRS